MYLVFSLSTLFLGIFDEFDAYSYEPMKYLEIFNLLTDWP